jgi:asparagine N-glycosylation enzyme membrane subunit Stt3
MEKYFITEIVDMDCDDDGLLNVKFIIEGDETNSYREIKTVDYYEWVEENYNDETLSDEWEEEYYPFNESFNFIQWKDYNHCEEIVIKFIEDIYPTIESLPIKINQI